MCQTLLINSGDSFNVAWDFIEEANTTLPVLLDTTSSVYMKWSFADNFGQPTSPFPLQMVINEEGIVTYISKTHDPEAVRQAIDAALAD